jgi:hypothetical protein
MTRRAKWVSPIDALILKQHRQVCRKIDFRKVAAKGVDPAMIARLQRAEKRLEKKSENKR